MRHMHNKFVTDIEYCKKHVLAMLHVLFIKQIIGVPSSKMFYSKGALSRMEKKEQFFYYQRFCSCVASAALL